MKAITTACHAVEWKVSVAPRETPHRRAFVGIVRLEDGRYYARRGLLILGNYATRDGAKTAVVRNWELTSG